MEMGMRWIQGANTSKKTQNEAEEIAAGDGGEVNLKESTPTGHELHNQVTKQYVEEKFWNKQVIDQTGSSNKPEENSERIITNPGRDTRVEKGIQQPQNAEGATSNLENDNMSTADNF